MTALRAGLAGCGPAGAWSLAAADPAGCRIVAAWDPDAGAAAALLAQHGLTPGPADFAGLLATGVDLVILATPVAERLDQVRAAADQGVHCLLHAPIAADARQAAAMVAACDRAGVRLGVLVADFADPLLDEVRQAVADGALGVPVLAWFQRGAADMPPDPTIAGERTLLHAAPAVHLAAWLLGRDPEAVSGLATATAGAADGYTATVRMRGGCLATLAASRSLSAASLIVHGTAGRVRLDADGLAVAGDVSWPEASPGRGPGAAGAHELHGRFARWIDDADDYPCPGDQAAVDMLAVDALVRADQACRRL